MSLLLLSPEAAGRYEARRCNELFENGLPILLLRLKCCDIEGYRSFLREVKAIYRDRIVLADYHETLIDEFSIGGFYCSNYTIADKYNKLYKLSRKHKILMLVGVHDLEELKSLDYNPDIALLSPVYNSLSKKGYTGNKSLLQLGDELRNFSFRVYAMGGITADNCKDVLAKGFDGYAALGDIWHEKGKELSTYKRYPKVKFFSLAGVDPSGGAGILADAKVGMSLDVVCVGVPTSLTIQSLNRVLDISACEQEDIETSIKLNVEDQAIKVAKIGLCCTLETVYQTAVCIKSAGVKKVIWDPIIKTTADNCTALRDLNGLESVLNVIDIITPNSIEAKALFGSCDAEHLKWIANKYDLSILLKGGHASGNQAFACTDTLYTPFEDPYTFKQSFRTGASVHGTGCMLSAAIVAALSKGYNLHRACQSAQAYVHKAMQTCNRLACLPKSLETEKLARVEKDYHLQYVSNIQEEGHLIDFCTRALKAGLKWIQLRLKEADTEMRVKIGKPIQALCENYGAIFIIDDDIEACIAIGADGLHLGRNDMPPLEARRLLGTSKIIGCTCNTEADILRAYDAGADYIGVGPFRYTSTKKNLATLLGADGLARLAGYNNALAYPMPMVAIGGIKPEDTITLRTLNIYGVAMSSALEQSKDLEKDIETIYYQLTEAYKYDFHKKNHTK